MSAPTVSAAAGASDFSSTNQNPNYFGTAEVWQKYHDVRPAYPKQLFDLIFDYHRKHSSSFKLAADFGSGPGTIVPDLLRAFERVEASGELRGKSRTVLPMYAVPQVPRLTISGARLFALSPPDLNEWQVGTGRELLQKSFGAQRVGFHHGAAGECNWIEDGTADLFIAAEAAQWFDMAKWGKEAAAKLRSGGTIAMIYYGCNATIVDPPEAAHACNKLFSLREYAQTAWCRNWLRCMRVI